MAQQFPKCLQDYSKLSLTLVQHLLISVGIRHSCDVYAYMQANHALSK